jgi:hypothetical protein
MNGFFVVVVGFIQKYKKIMAGYPLCLLTLLRDYPLPCRLLPKTWSLKHYLGTPNPFPLFVYLLLILYFSLSASALFSPTTIVFRIILKISLLINYN